MNSTFQSVLMVVFGFIGVGAILIFSGIIPLGTNVNTYGGTVTLWGGIPTEKMRNFVDTFNSDKKEQLTLNYIYKDPSRLESELISALANNEGPDLVIFPHDLIVKQSGKLFSLPYESYSERSFKDIFAEIGEVYLGSKGVLALPLYVDPMVMYWNRDIFSTAGLTSFPKNWVEFLKLPDVLTKRDGKGNIFQSAVALGTYRNINNAKEILSTLFLQSGDSIVKRKTYDTGERTDSFIVSFGVPEAPAESAVHFYTEFSNQSRTAYSWNSSLANSRKAFEAGTLAIYFGKASEYQEIKRNNPHLNFDVAMMPQRDNSSLKITYGDVSGIGILKSSKNINTAIKVAYDLSGANYGKNIINAVSLPSVRRDLLNETETRPEFSVFNRSAIISKTWYDPDRNESNSIFMDMIESINRGSNSELSAISDAKTRLSEYVK